MDYATWEDARKAAIAGQTCFCVHGCTEKATHISRFLGLTVPGLCEICFAASRTKGGHKAHHVMRNAGDIREDQDPAMQEPVQIRQTIKRFLGIDDRSKAERYVREYGANGLRVVSDLYDKVAAGKHLTDAEVEAVLRSKQAESQSAEAALKRIMKTERKAAKTIDLNKVFIGDDVVDGDYAVVGDDGETVILRVSRLIEGGFRGFTVVNCVVGEGVQKWGVQYPQPARWTNPDHRQFYRGYMAHLVAELAANPTAARALYQRVSAERAA